MHRLLIVDDEPYIVDGLFELFAGLPHLELDVCRAYSPIEALEWLERARIDIVLTDIRMPLMNGIELQKKINRQWPRCKVIFLTGYDDFAYIQEALRNGIVDYVLKTEYDEAIVKSVEQAIHTLAGEMRSEQIVVEARAQMIHALPALQKEYLLGFLADEVPANRLDSGWLKELKIALNPEEPCMLVVGRVDRWEDGATYSDMGLLMYAVQNVAKEYFGNWRFQPVLADRKTFIWFIQTETATEGREEKTDSFVHGTLESVQATCRELLKLPISLAAGSSFVPFGKLPAAYVQLKKILNLGLGQANEMLLTDRWYAANDLQSDGDHRSGAGEPDREKWRKQISELEKCLENSQQEQFGKHLDQLQAAILTEPYRYGLLLESYYSVMTLLLSHLNEPGADLASAIDLDKLTRFDQHGSAAEAFRYLRVASEVLFDRKRDELDERTSWVTERINRYIAANLDQDLSLTKLSEQVYLNPTYLSRFYKQTMGIGLSDYIAEARVKKSMELLRDPKYKIHEIGAVVGYASAPYFTTFFKRMTQMTPQEYRDANR
ncbi:response regulator transcription factor [Cohnella nanjingensis]|uniref:Response regulator n=1 Tax=Cohnella nanjingensis TaxID=1387779 RepID=A0A7X0RUA1_9BACL|nr:response regulator [Cohnella nanjingensis]MBB6673799.1 response regulator [Cohnella nanjingensis]